MHVELRMLAISTEDTEAFLDEVMTNRARLISGNGKHKSKFNVLKM